MLSERLRTSHSSSLFGQIIFHILFYRQVRLKRFALAIVLSLAPYLFLWAPILLAQLANSARGRRLGKKARLVDVRRLALQLRRGILACTSSACVCQMEKSFDSSEESGKPGLTSLPALAAVNNSLDASANFLRQTNL